MAEPQASAGKSPEDQIRALEKFIVEADIAGMAQVIGELHERWSEISEPLRSDILKLEAIFLSLLNARVKKS